MVPRAELPELISGVKEIGARYNFKSVCYGHAGDGNLHINIVRGEMSEEERLMLDNTYAQNHSFLNDIRLIFKTIPALFQQENV